MTSDSSVVSIVIPAYNAARFISTAIESVIAQTYLHTEIIVVDDGSTDSTAAVVSSFADVKYIYQNNCGPASARNTGLKVAIGEFIAFLDADDYWHPDMLQSCMDIFAKQPEIGAVHVNWLPVDADGQIKQSRSSWKPWRGNIFERLLLDMPFNFSSLVCRRECYEVIGGFDQTPAGNDDWINWLRVAYHGYIFEAIETPLVQRRFHTGSITRQKTEMVVNAELNCLDLIFSEVKASSFLSQQAYGRAYWRGTIALLQNGMPDKAYDYFAKTLHYVPEILFDEVVYYAFTHNTDNQFIGISVSEQRIDYLLKIANDNGAFKKVDDRLIKAFAYYTLAKIVYGQQLSSRSLFARSFRASPKVALNHLGWTSRLIIGAHLIGQTKNLVRG